MLFQEYHITRVGKKCFIKLFFRTIDSNPSILHNINYRLLKRISVQLADWHKIRYEPKDHIGTILCQRKFPAYFISPVVSFCRIIKSDMSPRIISARFYVKEILWWIYLKCGQLMHLLTTLRSIKEFLFKFLIITS